MTPKFPKAAFLMGKAKAALILDQPFFASIICNMQMIEDETLNPPTAATNGKVCWYHPGFVESLSLDEVKFLLCHEVGHAVFAHMFRRGDRNPKKWNMAGDYIINDLLDKEKIGKMPEGGLHNPQLVIAGGETTEGVYALLPDNDENCSGPGEGGGAWDECRDSGGSDADRSQAEAEMRVQVAQAAQAAKMCGKTSVHLEKFIDGALKPKVDWRNVLRNFITAKVKVEYTFARPKRRFIAEDIFLPSLGGESMGEILIAIDQSGSVTEQEVLEFKSEIMAIQQDVKPAKIHVFYFDSEVQHIEAYGPDDELDIRRYACGGTAFSPIFRKAYDMDLDPACCVVLTDLCCADFGPPPHYPVLWVSTMAGVADWGQVVEMNPRL